MSTYTGEADRLSSLTSMQPCHHFSLLEIQSATNDFDDQLVVGEGGFGKVYKGNICIEETSHVVAIKRLDSMSDQGAPEFKAEIEMLSKLRHCHLVSLIGFCDDNKEMILVYEYMPHGTLDHHLHKAETPLSWMQRLKIALGAAHGLDYLHTGVGTPRGVIHRDIKSSNILLDENWEAMISDFGLSKVGPTNQSISYVEASVKGTFGYLDPEYFYINRLTRKTDVYAFGVVLFELLSGRCPVDISFGEEYCSLVRWAQKCVKDRKLDQMVDYNIKGTVFPKCLTQFAQLAYRCVHGVPEKRPCMTEVVASLQFLLELQEKHKNSAESLGKKGFAWKIHKYLVPRTKQNPVQSGTSSQKSLSIKNDGSDHGEMTPRLGKLVGVARDLKEFTYVELQCATRSFEKDGCLVLKGVVEVFKGWVDKTTYFPSNDDTGLPIAIKRLYRHKDVNLIKFDLDVLKEVSDHPNLVKLIGCCLTFEKIFLVYEFMPLGNFEYCLHTGALLGLLLVTKAKIAVGIARGMVFLQKKREQKSESMFHNRYKAFPDKDFEDYLDNHRYNPWSNKKSSRQQSYDVWKQTIDEYGFDRRNILLDEDFTAKLSNYQRAAWPYKEFDSCYLWNDASGFAVVLAEVVMGRKISYHVDFFMIEFFLRKWGKKSFKDIADLCFGICNEVDSESVMVTLLKEHEGNIRMMRSLCR